MKVHLMFRSANFDMAAKPCFGKDALEADLGLDKVIDAMSGGDETIATACKSALYDPLCSSEEITYRQANLRDALKNPQTVRNMYAIASDALEKKRKSGYWLSSAYLSSTFYSAKGLMGIYLETLGTLRCVAKENEGDFRSKGFEALLDMLRDELNAEYLGQAQALLAELERDDGFLISARLGSWNQGVGYVLRGKEAKRAFRRRWRFAPSFTISQRDMAGATDLGKRRDRAVNEATNALAQSAEHVKGFLTSLKNELAFYVGCINLVAAMRDADTPICIPNMLSETSSMRSWEGLRDICVVMKKRHATVGNDLASDGIRLYIVTGANQGGKSTFLRSMGQAQLMAQCGMPVVADSFTSPIRRGIYTHFKKEEDQCMESGKLDEELERMDILVNHLERNSLILFNESFATTNEREGSELCAPITRALIESDMEVFSVTHLLGFAEAFIGMPGVQYLRAQRLPNGTRTFRVLPGRPLRTAFGKDLYAKVFDRE